MKKKVLGLAMAIVAALPVFVNAEEVTTEAELATCLSKENATCTITEDISLTKTLPITKNNITLDLNGKTLSYESSKQGEAMITNEGSLTITDSTASANGKISFKYVGEPATLYGKGNYTIVNTGDLVIENGTVENITDEMKHASFTIDNHSDLTVNGGKVINNNYIAIRQNVSTKDNSLAINGGTVTGTRSVSIQLGSNTSVKPNVLLDITGGNLIGTEVKTWEGKEYTIAVYSYSDGTSLENVKINISGGILEGDLALSGGNNNEISELVNIAGGQMTDVYSYADKEVTRINISGGIFKNAPTAYLDKAEETKTETNVYEVEVKNENGKTETKYVVATEEKVVLAPYETYEPITGEDYEKMLNEVEEDEMDDATKKAFNEFKKLLEGKKIVSVHDISYGKFIEENLIVEDEVNHPTEGTMVKVTLDLPEGLEKVKEGYVRKYVIIRLHENEDGIIEVQELPATEKEGKITFETEKFSEFVLTYEDTKAATNPSTFDGISLYMIIASISLIGFVSLIAYSKKAKNY